jgi:ParB-like chromosome segregation protein Spo0J
MGSKSIPGTVRWDARAAENPAVIHIVPGFNARTDLGDLTSLKKSIREKGLKDALWVRPNKGNDTQPFLLIDGERRLTAMRELFCEGQAEGKEWDIKIPLQVFYVDAQGAEELMALALLEREQPSFADEAGLVARWIDRNFSVQEISDKLTRSTGWVEQRKVFALLEPPVKQAVREGKLSVQAAIDRARNVQPDQQVEVLTTVLATTDSARQTRKAVAQRTGTVVRPGKRELIKVVTAVTDQQVNGHNMTVKEAKRLVLAALRYCCGEMTHELFLDTYYGTINSPEESVAPPAVVNYVELG